MPDFSKGKIYKLVSNKSSDVYIGSCLVDLSKRLYGHKAPSNKCVSKGMFVNDAIISIVLIEDCPCENKNQLKARELHYITTINCININKPFISDIQIINGDSKEWNKQYYETNKEHIAQQQAQYYEINKEHIAQYYEINKEHIAQYYAAHKERIAEKAKQYYETHKEQIAQYNETNKEHIAQVKKQYNETNKEEIAEKNKQYNETNKEQIAQYQKQYREIHKEQIAQYNENHKEQKAQRDKQYYQLRKLKQSS